MAYYFNITAILFDSIGLLLTAFAYTPSDHRVFLYNKEERPAQIMKDRKRHRRTRVGFFALGLGLLLQLAALLMKNA